MSSLLGPWKASALIQLATSGRRQYSQYLRGVVMLKVLVVEDDRSVAGLVRHLLETEGFIATMSVDIEGAWGSLTGEPLDAAIIDLGLIDGQDGWDLIEKIRAHERYGDLPIVI